MAPKEPKKSRYIFGTLTAPKISPYTGEEFERDSIIENCKSSSKSYEYSIVCREKHSDDSIHYHFLIGYSSQVTKNVVDKLRVYYDQFSANNQIKFGDENYISMIGYICKDGDYKVDGELEAKIVNKAIQKYETKKKITGIEKSECIVIDKKVKKDRIILDWLREFMNRNNYKINYYKNNIYNGGEKDIDSIMFIEHINKENFQDTFGFYGIELFLKILNKRFYTDFLPTWKPDINIVKFSDCYYNMSNCKNISLEEGKNITPVRIYNYPIPLKGEIPINFMGIIKRHGWNFESFRDSYGRQYKDKRRRDSILYICGPSSTSKSSLVIPYSDVFKDIIGYVANDNNFSLSGIASCKRCLLEEATIFNCGSRDTEEMLKLLEGTEFTTSVKHGNPVIVVPKTIMCTSNIVPPDNLDLESNLGSQINALKNRTDIFVARIPVENEDINFMDKIRGESGQVLLWCTR